MIELLITFSNQEQISLTVNKYDISDGVLSLYNLNISEDQCKPIPMGSTMIIPMHRIDSILIKPGNRSFHKIV